MSTTILVVHLGCLLRYAMHRSNILSHSSYHGVLRLPYTRFYGWATSLEYLFVRNHMNSVQEAQRACNEGASTPSNEKQ